MKEKEREEAAAKKLMRLMYKENAELAAATKTSAEVLEDAVRYIEDLIAAADGYKELLHLLEQRTGTKAI